jgi:hypothetical protein
MLISGGRFRGHAEKMLVVVATGLYAAGLCFLPPTVFEGADFLTYFRPAFHFLAESVRTGVVPLWNPYVGLGRPFLADTQNVVCYPPTYLICFGQEFGVFLLTWLHGALAIVGMRRLGGVLGTGRWQGYLMGFSYLASGALIARWVTGQIGYCWALCYLPWLLYHAVRTEEPWQARRLGLNAGCLALQFLCGHPQVFWFSAMGQGTFILASTLRLPLWQSLRDLAHRLGQLAVACVWCAGFVAIALLPMLQLAHESNRGESTAAFANSYNMEWEDLSSLFVPRWRGLVWENNLLVGGAVVVIGILGLCRLRERNVRGLVGLLGIGLLLALGARTPMFKLFYNGLPGYAGFRFQSRAAVLVVVALICAEGMWLSRPHARLRAIWDRLLSIPTRYAVRILVAIQVLDLLQGAWATKRFVAPTCSSELSVPCEHSAEHRLQQALRLVPTSTLPPRVCVSPSVIPADNGMIYHYASFDAAGSLFLRRPWDYLHGMLGLTPPIEKGSLSPQVYEHGPFPYDDLSVAVGQRPTESSFSVMENTKPRAFVVYAAQRADYDAVLDRLTNGHAIHECALIESPLAEPLSQTNELGHTPAVIKRFESNRLLVEFEAKAKGLLVLAEAWYPGWTAEIDGRRAACVPVNGWMRGVPVPAGRHGVQLRFRQDYLLMGALISAASLGLLAVALVRRTQPIASLVPAPEPEPVPARPGKGATRPLRRQPKPSARKQAKSAGRYHPLRVMAFGALVASAGWLVYAEIRQVRLLIAKTAGADALSEFRLGNALFKQEDKDKAMPHFKESLRLAERAFRLTDGKHPQQYLMLVSAYDAAGFPEKAMYIATLGRQLSLSSGQKALADSFQYQIDQITAKQAQTAEPK